MLTHGSLSGAAFPFTEMYTFDLMLPLLLMLDGESLLSRTFLLPESFR